MTEDMKRPEELPEDRETPEIPEDNGDPEDSSEIKVVLPTPEEIAELGGAGESTPDESESGEEEIRELREKAAKADDYFRRLQRLQAEFDNYRKRVERERGELRQWALKGLIEELVDVIDTFERALHEDHASEVPEPYRKGIEMVHRNLKETLSRYGLTRLDAVGEPFDPHFHEALTQEINDEYPEGVICGEIKPGYLLGERLLRPSLVRVSAGPGKT
jgi:molecular chaperone GrpE